MSPKTALVFIALGLVNILPLFGQPSRFHILHLPSNQDDNDGTPPPIADNSSSSAYNRLINWPGAAKNDNRETIESLLANGAPINATNQWEQTALILALLNDRDEIAFMLFKKGADANIRSKQGTAFMLAHKKSFLDIIKDLIIGGHVCDLSLHNYFDGSKDYTPLSHAIQKGQTEIVDLILKKITLEQEDKDEALQEAVQEGCTEIVSLLIQAGANVNSKNDRNKTPLMRAANINIAQLLIGAGADLNIVDHYQKTALMIICSNDLNRREDLAIFLIEKGADIHARDSEGWTALMFAASHSLEAVVQILLNLGADPSIQSNDSRAYTALGLAKKVSIKALIENYISTSSSSSS